MKKIYFLAISVMSFQTMNAQITLTAANNNPSIGDNFSNNQYDASTIGPGNAGSNVTWNFSSLTAQSSGNIQMVNPSTLTDVSNHPSSNLAGLGGAGSTPNSEAYYFIDSDEWSIVGSFIPGILRESYQDAKELVKFPITFGNSFSETFNGTFNNLAANQTFDRGGSITISADGFGNLTFPFGTITNVLRVKTILTYTDKQGGITMVNYQDTNYFWYNSGTNFPLLTWTSANSDFSSLKFGTYLNQASIITSLGDNFIPNNPITIYPNPATNNQTNILLDKLYNNAQIQLIDITGKTVKMENISATSKNMILNLDGLDKGIYFVQIFDNDALVSSEKLILN